MLNPNVKIRPELDKDFVPAVLWNKSFLESAAKNGWNKIVIALERSCGTVSIYRTSLHVAPEFAALNLHYVERLVKFMLWMRGGYKITIAGDSKIADSLKAIYSKTGARSFDAEIMEKVYGRPLEVHAVSFEDAPEEKELSNPLGRNLDGCRIGFDLGGSDRKCAATIDGKVVFTEEIPWDPYFQKDPSWHKAGINDTLKRAAAHLPRVDAIGGSSAGVYVDNMVRIASLFRGVSKEDFDNHVKGMFLELKKEWGDIPFDVVNDGEVTALAGSMEMNDNSVLGVSMGTSMAGGYVNSEGNITDWLNEIAFAPIDYRDNAPADEWSGDIGCGVQYFSQQGVARLAGIAGIQLPASMPAPEKLVEVQKLMKQDDPKAASVYRNIGVCFGYSIAHYAEFYDLRNLLILGRVTSGRGGEIILEEARKVLDLEFPELSKKIQFRIPDEKNKRHGQAVAAASLPSIVK